jgi:hypothetical protein
MQRFTPCAQQPRGVTGPLAGSRAELEGMFCPEAPRGPDGDSDPTGGGGGSESLLRGPVHTRGGPRPFRGGLHTWGFGFHPWGSKPVGEVLWHRLEITVWVLCFPLVKSFGTD